MSDSDMPGVIWAYQNTSWAGEMYRFWHHGSFDTAVKYYRAIDTDRPIDEVFDVQKDVEQNPCGALMAIHSLHATVIEQQAEIERLREAAKRLLDNYGFCSDGSDHYREMPVEDIEALSAALGATQ